MPGLPERSTDSIHRAGGRRSAPARRGEVVGVGRVRARPQHRPEEAAGLGPDGVEELGLVGPVRHRLHGDAGTAREGEGHHVDGVGEGVLAQLGIDVVVLAAADIGAAEFEAGQPVLERLVGLHLNFGDPARQRLGGPAGERRALRQRDAVGEPRDLEGQRRRALAFGDRRQGLEIGPEPLQAGAARGIVGRRDLELQRRIAGEFRRPPGRGRRGHGNLGLAGIGGLLGRRRLGGLLGLGGGRRQLGWAGRRNRRCRHRLRTRRFQRIGPLRRERRRHRDGGRRGLHGLADGSRQCEGEGAARQECRHAAD